MAASHDYKFTVVFEQDDDGGYVVRCPSLPGCYSQGDTYDEALANIRSAIALVIEDMRESGEAIPQEARAETIDIAV
jgi:predicted RNase H-like HicB family nuclease